MIDIKRLRKAHILLKKEGKLLTPDYFEYLEKNTEDKDLMYFYRGCKHTLERHFTEAIKWFQLIDDEDAVLMILLNAYKIGDSFLFSEYFKEDLKGNILKKTGLQVFLKIDNKEYPVDMHLIKELKKQLEV